MEKLIKKSYYFTTYSEDGKIIVEDVKEFKGCEKCIKKEIDEEKSRLHEIFERWAEIYSTQR